MKHSDFFGNFYLRELKKYILLALLIGVFYSCYALPYNDMAIGWNIPAYIISVVVVFGIMFCVNKLAVNVRKNVILLLNALIYIYITLALETNMFAGSGGNLCIRNRIDHRIYFGFLIIFSTMLAKLIISYQKGRQGLFRKCLNIAVAMLMAIFSYSINPFKDQFGGLYHTEAYINSIINVVHLTPFSDYATGVYGHYGIILMPFVKLLGGDLKAIMLCISLMVFLIHFFVGKIIDRFVSNDLLYFVGIISLTSMATVYRATGNYFQVYPHRVLFPTIGIAYITLSNRKGKNLKRRFIEESLLGILAMVWNIESGVAVLASVLAVEFFDKFRWDIKLIIDKLIYAVVVLIVSFGGAYIIVNIYNLLCHGTINSLETFIFPIGSSSYMIGVLRTIFAPPIYPYVLFVFCFCLGVFPVILNCLNGKAKPMESEDILRLSTGVCGLLTITYFINRQAIFNVYIAYFQLMILLIYAANRDIKLSDVKYTLNHVAMLMVCAVAFESLISTATALDARISSVWEKDSLDRDVEAFNDFLLEDTLVVGVGTPTFCAYANINPGAYFTDPEDLFVFDYVENKILEYNRVVMTDGNFDKLDEILAQNGYVINRDFIGENITMHEYVKQ